MEKKQEFFSVLTEEVVRRLSSMRARLESTQRGLSMIAGLLLLRWWRCDYQLDGNPMVLKSSNLTSLIKELDPGEVEGVDAQRE